MSSCSEQRRAGRLRCDSARTDLGPVLDVSATGLRLAVKHRLRVALGQDLTFTLHLPDRKVTLTGRVVRHKRVGLFSHEVGLEFVDACEESNRALRDLARGQASQVMSRSVHRS